MARRMRTTKGATVPPSSWTGNPDCNHQGRLLAHGGCPKSGRDSSVGPAAEPPARRLGRARCERAQGGRPVRAAPPRRGCGHPHGHGRRPWPKRQESARLHAAVARRGPAAWTIQQLVRDHRSRPARDSMTQTLRPRLARRTGAPARPSVPGSARGHAAGPRGRAWRRPCGRPAAHGAGR
jgi:hypothetical protein